MPVSRAPAVGRQTVIGPGSAVRRAARRVDPRQPIRVEKDEPLKLLLVEDTDDDADLV